MISADTMRTCPYCGAGILLAACDVVATASSVAVPAGASGGFDDLDDGTDAPTNSREVLRLGKQPADEQPPTGWQVITQRSQRQLTPVLEGLDVERVPRRACSACSAALPLELDDRDAHVVSVVGLNAAGKTHYLTQALVEASRKGGIRRFGCSEFVPIEDTANRLQQYYVRVHRERGLLDPTQLDHHVRRSPLSFAVTMASADPIVLLTHDVPGEVFADHRLRASVAPFVRRSSAMVFLLDPLEFEAVRRKVPRDLLPLDRDIDQVDMLRQCLAELRTMPRPTPVPVAITISKADLLSTYCGITGAWQKPPADDVFEDIKICHDDVRDVLAELGEHEVLAAAEDYGPVTFHAVSALGGLPSSTGLEELTPLRCADPLGTALVRLTRR